MSPVSPNARSVFATPPGTIIVRIDELDLGLPYAEDPPPLKGGTLLTRHADTRRAITLRALFQDLRKHGYGYVAGNTGANVWQPLTRLRFVHGAGDAQMPAQMIKRLRHVVCFGTTVWANRLQDGGRLDVVHVHACQNLRYVVRQARAVPKPGARLYQYMMYNRPSAHALELFEMPPILKLRFKNIGGSRPYKPGGILEEDVARAS